MLNYNGNTISIYCVYHDPALVEKWKLDTLDKNLFTLYYTKGNHENSLDNVQEFVNEFTAQYFVYKNNIKTDYVGFCQYHRLLNINLEKFFEENGIAAGMNWGSDSWANFEKYRFNNFLTKDLHDYIVKNYKKKDRIYKYFVTNKDVAVPFYINEIYICKWEYFEEMCKFISGFIEYINDVYDLKWDKQEWHYFILDTFIDKKLTEGFSEGETPWWFENKGRNFWRVIGNVIELLLGVYFGHLTKELSLPEYRIPSKAEQEAAQKQQANS